MAKLPKVKCKYCGLAFSRETEEFEKIGNRYAHKQCYLDFLNTQTQEDKDREDFYAYLKQLFGQYNYIVTNKMAEKYIRENNYTYIGMKRALQYFYEIKKNPIEKANGSIGIVPYSYDEANRYFNNIEKAQKKNADKQIERNMNPVRVIHIPRPQIEKKKKRKLFKFLDEGED